MERIIKQIKSNQAQLLFILLLIFSFLIRLYQIDYSIWIDEIISFDIAFADDFLSALRHTDHPPLYFILLRLWGSFSLDTVYLRVLAVLCGVGTVAVMFIWLRRYSLLAAVIAGLLSATTPIFIIKSQEIRHYSLLSFTVALSFYFADRYVQERSSMRAGRYLNKNFWGLVVAMSLVVLTHLVGLFVLISVFVYVVLSIKPWINSRKDLMFVLSPFLLPALIAIGIVFYFLNSEYLLSRSNENWWIQQTSFSNWFSVILTVLGVTYTYSWLGAWHLAFVFIYLILIVALVFIIIVFGREWTANVFLLAALGFWGCLGIYSGIAIPVFYNRQAIPGAVPFIVFVALAISKIRKSQFKKVAVLLVVLVAALNVSGFLFGSVGKVPEMEWEQASQLLEDSYVPGEKVWLYPFYVDRYVNYFVPLVPGEDYVRIPIYPGEISDEMWTTLQNYADYSEVTYLVVWYDVVALQNIDLVNSLKNALAHDFCQDETVFANAYIYIERYSGCP